MDLKEAEKYTREKLRELPFEEQVKVMGGKHPESGFAMYSSDTDKTLTRLLHEECAKQLDGWTKDENPSQGMGR